MNSCSIAVSQVRRAFLNRKAKAENLIKTMAVTVEGEVLSETISRADEALALLDSANYKALDDLKRGHLLNNVKGMTVRAELTDVFQGAISVAPTSKTPTQALKLKSIDFNPDKSVTVVVTPEGKNKYWTYTFGEDEVISKTAEDGTRLRISAFDTTIMHANKAAKKVKVELDPEKHFSVGRSWIEVAKKAYVSEVDLDELLSSAKGATFDYTKASEVVGYEHGNVQHMKNLLSDLYLTDNNVPEGLLNQYYKLLDKMHPSFFRNMTVFINENANHTHGWVDLDKDHILLNKSSVKYNDMSNIEVYMHEVVHTMTMWALRQEGFGASKLKTRLRYLRRIAAKNVSWKDIAEANKNLTEEQAKERHKYIFEHENSLDEFLAFAVTNPSFDSLLKEVKLKEEKERGLLNAIKDFFSDMINAVLGNYSFKNRNSDVSSEIHALAFKLAEINNDAKYNVDNNWFNKVGDLVNSIESGFEDFVDKTSDSLFDKTSNISYSGDMNFIQKVIYMTKVIIKSLYNKDYRHALGRYFSLLKIKPDNSLREIARALIPKLDEDTDLELLGLQTTNIDTSRNTIATVAAESIVYGFKNRPSEEEEVATTTVIMESNGSALFKTDKNKGKGYTDQQLYKILTDTAYRKRTTGRVEATIRRNHSKRANWVIGQAGGLGKLMATGKGHSAQNTNSLSIVVGHTTNEYHKVDENLLSLVEELAALRALDFQNSKELKTLGELLRKDPEGVKNVVKMYESFKEQSKEELFKDDKSHMMEGYIKELFDDSIDVRYEFLEETENMKKQGFRLISEVSDKDRIGGKKIGIFVSDTYTKSERQRGAVSLGNPSSRGLTLKDIRLKQFGSSNRHAMIYFESDRIEAEKKAISINARLEAGESFENIEEGPVPVLNASGRVVDYRIMMDKRAKMDLLKQDKTISSVLSKTTSSILDKTKRAEHNKKVLDHIIRYAEDVYDKNDKDNIIEMTLISADSTDKEIKDLYNMLPQIFRDYANTRADKSIPIPSLLMNQYFGYKHYTFSNLPGLNKLPIVAKRILNMFEAYWVDLVKIAKGNILLKMPIILVENIVSNIVFALMTVSNPLELLKHYIDSFREVKDFMKLHKEYEHKKLELNSLTQEYMTRKFTAEELVEYNESLSKLKKEVELLEKDMNSSEVKELFDIGMYQSVIEDVEMYKLGDTNRISGGVDRVLKKVPTVIKTPLQVLYLSKETSWYKVNQEVLQLSDLVARDVMNRKMKMLEKRQMEGKMNLPLEYRKSVGNMEKRRVLGNNEKESFLAYSKKLRHYNILNSFVNYNIPNGKGEEFLNRIGLLMFTKYLKRIQHVISSNSIKHPIRSSLALAFSAFAIDLSMIQDSSIIARAFDGNDNGLFGIVPVYSPLYVLETVVNPPLVRLIVE